MPSHDPLAAQLNGVPPRASVHWLLGSVATFVGPHTPLPPLCLSDAEHAMHVLEQAESQQKPSTQLPDAHCEALKHVAPNP